MNPLENKHILLGITGGIAAYKIPLLIRALKKAGAKVRVVMTESAKAFVTPLTLQTLSEETVHTDLFSDPMAHITLARWADIVFIAPASANIIAKLAHGFADDLLSTLCIATQTPIAIAPAMNQQMWQNTATLSNINQLLTRGIICFGPDEGEQACGEYGPGRMQEPDILIEQLKALYRSTDNLEIPKEKAFLAGKRLLITAGPTQEPIDAARYISNYSSGKMGYALANAAVTAGANVTLISGPTTLPRPNGLTFISVTTAIDMHQAVMQHASTCDIFISAAAVGDFRLANPTQGKIKKQPNQTSIDLTLTTNPDIVAEVARLPKEKRPFTVGFAAEYDSLEDNAHKKRLAKHLDMIIVNQIGQNDRGFNADTNAATILWQNGKKNFPLQPKTQLAKNILYAIIGNVIMNKRMPSKPLSRIYPTQ